MKQCYRCKEWKPLEKYNKDKKTKDGKDCYCRDCRKILNKEWREKNKERRKEYSKRYKEANKEYFNEYQKAYNKKYWKKNKEILTEKKKEYYLANTEKLREKAKKWREANKERKREMDHNYYKNNKEKHLENGRKWIENNKERHIAYHKKLYEDLKEQNNKKVVELVEKINPVFYELGLPVYGYVYKIENIKTKKVYIGQTVNPLEHRYGKNVIKGWIKERLARDKQKFKEELIEEDFIYTETLDVGCCAYHLDKLESYYINKFNSWKNGYNNDTGRHKTNDGIEEFNEIMEKFNLRHMIEKGMEAEGITIKERD
jgi:hypothetical protein